MPERLFFVQYGEVGHRATKSKVGQMYQVRRAAMALADAASKSFLSIRSANHDPLAASLLMAVKRAFLEAPVGILMDGYVITYEVGDTTRYIAVIPVDKEFKQVKYVDHGEIVNGKVMLSGRVSKDARLPFDEIERLKRTFNETKDTR